MHETATSQKESFMSSPEQRLRDLGIALPDLPVPVGNFVPAVLQGGLAFFSGQGPLMEDGRLAGGKVGKDVTADEACYHARRTGIVLLAAMRRAFGSLDRVERIVKIFGMVNAVPDFEDHPAVINGCSDLMVEVFGEAGHHARSAVGMASLPMGITVEIEAVVAFRPD
jgi:enamine deaminase RidA (YjgF/YER057c/UK114 family)